MYCCTLSFIKKLNIKSLRHCNRRSDFNLLILRKAIVDFFQLQLNIVIAVNLLLSQKSLAAFCKFAEKGIYDNFFGAICKYYKR